jgi:hypothetical protein
MLKKLLPFVVLALLLPATAFAVQEVMSEEILSPDMLGIQINRDLKSQALRFDTKWPVTISLKTIDARDKHIEQTKLSFSAQVRSQNLDGAAYLEMWMHFPGITKYVVSRGFERPLKGTAPWSKLETNFTLSKGQVPDQVVLNLVINGKGTVWLKDIHLDRDP